MCKISVVTSIYNGEKYIDEAIESVLSQTFGDFEFIILDNCSIDRSAEQIKAYDDPRIRFVQNETNLGISGSLNRGIELSRGEYIARLDADDVCYPDRFEKQVQYLDSHPEICMCSGWFDLIEGGKAVKTRDRKALSPDEMRFIQYFMNQVSHSTVMMRASVLREHTLRYNEAYKGAQDYGLWMDMLPYGNLTVLGEKLVWYRIHETNISKDTRMMNSEVDAIQQKAYRTMDVPEETKALLLRAEQGELTDADELFELGQALLEYYRQCGLSMGNAGSREQLEIAYYTLLLNHMHMGFEVYRSARRTGIFRLRSEYGHKTLIRSILRKGI